MAIYRLHLERTKVNHRKEDQKDDVVYSDYKEDEPMEYIKIRADFRYAEKGRLYRVFLVPPNMNLFELGCRIVGIFQGTLEHCFLYTHGKTQLVPASFMEDTFPGIKAYWMGQYAVENLPDTFDFEYDTGDGWVFRCKKYKTVVNTEYEGDPRIIVLEGKGQGIWEDNITTLYAYFEGKLKPDDIAEESEEEGYYLPWNVSIEKWGDYDAPIDLDLIEDITWEDSWREEKEYAAQLGLDKVRKEPDPFHLYFSEDNIRFAFKNTLADTLAYAYGYEGVIKKAKEIYGDPIGEDRYRTIFSEEIDKVLTPEVLEKLFLAIDEKIGK